MNHLKSVMVEYGKILITNLGLVLGTAVTYIDSVNAVVKLIATVVTLIVALMTIEKLYHERKKRRKS